MTDARSPRLLPWRERVDPRSFGAALGYAYTIDHSLEVMGAERPDFADEVKKAQARRAELYGPGLAAIERIAVKEGMDLEKMHAKTRSPEREAKLRAGLPKARKEGIATLADFEAPSPDDPGCLLYAWGQPDETYTRELAKNLVVRWSGARTDAKGRLTISFELPAGWCSKTAKENIVLRAVSQAGFGDDTVSVFVDGLEAPLNAEQEENFWKLMHGREQYERAGASTVQIKDTKVDGARAVEVLSAATATPTGWANRAVLRQTTFLHGRWGITLQVMSAAAKPSAVELPSVDESILAFKRLDGVWDRMVSSLKFEEVSTPAKDPGTNGTPAKDPPPKSP